VAGLLGWSSLIVGFITTTKLEVFAVLANAELKNRQLYMNGPVSIVSLRLQKHIPLILSQAVTSVSL